MSNPFKYFKDKKEIWADWVKPTRNNYPQFETFDDVLNHYNSRPHFPVSPEPDWEDGKIVYEGKDFKIEWLVKTSSYQGNAEYYIESEKKANLKYSEWSKWDGNCMAKTEKPIPIAIPLPKEAKVAIDPREYAKIAAKNEGVYTPKLKSKEQQDIPMEKDWVKRYEELRQTLNMTYAIQQLAKEVSAFAQSPKEEKES